MMPAAPLAELDLGDLREAVRKMASADRLAGRDRTGEVWDDVAEFFDGVPFSCFRKDIRKMLRAEYARLLKIGDAGT